VRHFEESKRAGPSGGSGAGDPWHQHSRQLMGMDEIRELEAWGRALASGRLKPKSERLVEAGKAMIQLTGEIRLLRSALDQTRRAQAEQESGLRVAPAQPPTTSATVGRLRRRLTSLFSGRPDDPSSG
jgi:hypothetical protein